jgi:membrane-associated phospholipid phosphatase
MVARPPLSVPLGSLAGFLALLGFVLTDWAPLVRFDVAVSDAMWAYGTANPDVVSAMLVATDVAATNWYLLAGLVATTILVVRRRRAPALLCAAATVVIPLLWSLMHWLLLAPRPENAFVSIHSNGFPSGHTANATAAGLVAVLMIWPRASRVGRAMIVTAAAALASFVGLTRVALLAHWPADVLGGWLLGLTVVPLLARLVSHGSAAADPPGAPLNPETPAAPAPGSPPGPDSADRARRGSD